MTVPQRLKQLEGDYQSLKSSHTKLQQLFVQLETKTVMSDVKSKHEVQLIGRAIDSSKQKIIFLLEVKEEVDSWGLSGEMVCDFNTIIANCISEIIKSKNI